MLDVGDEAPEFALANQHGETVRRTDFEGERLVVYFYPRADTDGCTTEARAFDDAKADFGDRGVSIVGISDDPVDDLESFAAKYDLGFDLLSDEMGEVATLYDSYGEKQMFGNTFDGVFRNTYVLDPEGRVEAVYENVTPEGHAEEILADLEDSTTEATP
ncbi:thioredoxin-dependent thiol peroxidase [Natronolimnohabitans innermongolicus]|uniref:thioredoxin-dependent peroxiredoxin n=1 Tax=Natronolimnohabitans innermongolicus JCM 12255 TaxID=1227499 RepID=L9WJ77_9EURY|nr:thioredoxin-dependent thiol peroxidase [Natronolimnohabitans innermongolicus]ELY49520.1 alkyl hydroperoxide reductase/ thiol specific antioxidant/ Mal allergen [Natronolimnohabitans innermongolicus JCM 12255]